MRRLWRSALAMAAATPACGQILNLGTPPEPPPRLELALTTPRRTLEAEARRGEEGAAGSASAALRRAGATLLARGEAPNALSDPDATRSALLGLTIARRRADLDAAIGEVHDAAMLEWGAGALLQDDPAPAQVEEILRRLLAEVRPGVGTDAGWIEVRPSTRDEGPSLVEMGVAAGFAEESLAALDAWWRMRRSTRAWGREARVLHADVADALALFDPRRPAAPPARLAAWRQALARALEHPDDERSRATIARLAQASRLLSDLRQARLPGETRRILDALLALDPADPGLDDRLRNAASATAWATRIYNPAHERELTRELRVPFRQVGLATRESAAPLLRVVVEILTRPDAMADPAVLSTLNAHRDRWEEADRLRRLSDLIRDPSRAGPEPVVGEAFRGLARTLVLIQRDVSSPATREAALARRRDLVQRAVDLLHAPGEEILRRHASGEATVPGLEQATGGRARTLVERLDADRAEWLRGVADLGAPLPAAAESRLRGLARLIPMALDAAGCLAGGEGLNAWPGWECGPAAWAWMAGDLESRIALVCAEAARPGAVDLTRRLDELEQEHAPALLAGALARSWATRAEMPSDRIEAALAELAGPPAGETSWMARWRPELARMCLIAEEAAALAAGPDGSQERGRERLATLRRSLQSAARPVRTAGVP